MVFGENSLILKHLSSGTKIHFNAFDALRGWKQEALPPVEVPAAAKWKFRRWELLAFALSCSCIAQNPVIVVFGWVCLGSFAIFNF